MKIFIAPEMRKKRGSGLAQILTTTPTKTAPSTATSSFSPSQDPPQLTHGKSPALKKTRVSSKISDKMKAIADPKNFNTVCQICLKEGSGSNILWVECSGGCGRWHHHKCIKEYEHMSKIQV